MSISIVLDSGLWHLDARVRVLESGVQSHDSGVNCRATAKGFFFIRVCGMLFAFNISYILSYEYYKIDLFKSRC